MISNRRIVDNLCLWRLVIIRVIYIYFTRIKNVEFVFTICKLVTNLCVFNVVSKRNSKNNHIPKLSFTKL